MTDAGAGGWRHPAPAADHALDSCSRSTVPTAVGARPSRVAVSGRRWRTRRHGRRRRCRATGPPSPRDALAHQLLPEAVVGEGGPGDGAAGELAGDGGELVEGERLRPRERRGGALEAALVGQDGGGRLGEVGVRGPGDRPVRGEREPARARRVAEEVRRAGGVEAVAQRGERHPAGAQGLLGGGMVAAGLEARGRARSHLTASPRSSPASTSTPSPGTPSRT